MKNHFVLGMTILGFLCVVNPAMALFEEDKAELVKDARLTLVEAVDKALTSVQGKAVSAELEKEHDKIVFEVKILDATETIREIYVDAHSGNVLKIEKD
ncbi:MAG: PepSY domain-containing protein [Nitrospirales bacterium]|nr:PepSY domain-containing protein [Nitrospirales bacterium]